MVGLVASDAAGNTAESSFTVTIQDTTPPSLTVPADATVEATGPGGAIALYPAATATDAVGVTSITIGVNAVASDAVGVTSLKIVSVTSSEPDNGLGDGDTVGERDVDLCEEFITFRVHDQLRKTESSRTGGIKKGYDEPEFVVTL